MSTICTDQTFKIKLEKSVQVSLTMPRNTTYIYVQPSIPDLTLKQIQTEIQLFNET